MKLSKKAVKTINTVFFIIAALFICAYAAAAVIAHNYRRYEGTYISRRTSMNYRDYGNGYLYSIAVADADEFEHKDIVRITKQEGGYGIEYIMSSDGDMRNGNSGLQDYFLDGAESPGTAYNEPLLVTGFDHYREYHGVISEKAAKEGGIVECYETVTGQTKYIGIYFTQNGVCLLNDMDICFLEDGVEYEVSSWGKHFEYDSEYTFGDMLTAPKTERRYWIGGGAVCTCERTGYNVYGILDIAGGVAGTAAALFFAAALIMAAARERKKTAAVGLAVFGAAAAVFALAPAQSVAGRYCMADLSGMYIQNVFQAILDHTVTVEAVERNYEYVDIAPDGNGGYIVLFYKGGYIDTIASAESDWRGRLTFETDGYGRNEVSVRLTNGGISVMGKNRPTDTAYGYERLDRMGFNMRLRYFILLSFAVCVVVSLIMSVLRYKYRKAHPVICEGSYRITDILYMDGNMDYMRDYMLGNWRGVAVELKDSAFMVDGKDMGIYEHEPEYESRLGKLPGMLKLRRGICVKPARHERKDGDSGTEYCVIYDKKRRVFVYSVGEKTLAAFSLRPLIKNNCGVGV